MKLQTKAVVAFNFSIIAVCCIMGFLGYRSAADGLEIAMQRSARSNINAIVEIMENKHPGDWAIIDGKLYKGEDQISDHEEIPDYLGKICEGHVTFFLGDTRVATTVKDDTGKRVLGTKASEKIINEVLVAGKPYAGRAMVVGKEYDSAYTPIKDTGGKVIGMIFVGLPSEELADDVKNDLLASLAIAIAVVVVILGLLSWIIIGRQMKKLELVSEAMEEISAGNLAVQDMEVTSEDEIGILSKDMNEMKKKLRVLLRDVLESSEKVAASSQELTANTDQTSTSINQVAANTVDLVECASKQAGTVEDLQGVIDDMGEKINELREGAKTMDTAAKASQQGAIVGKQKVDYAINQIQMIEKQVNKSTEVVDTLGKRSEEIGTIVGTISEIANQTNLLALNAAIEAARAGEHGRGFAVVAEEVRKLAEQSATAAQNISELIKHIQNETASAVKEMELGNAGVKEGAESVMATGEAFKTIEDQIQRLNENVQRSLQHIDAVNNTSHSILEALDSVQKISQKSEEEAQNISAATQQQAATMHEMSDAGRELASLAQKLQSEVSQFKI
ncbi:MAG: methyl-accepting chemotaxis protein [Selenomonadaceae bacterium]|nr:methyl-accepting chemotaxis protein [Selenomonadaceae bacterium]